MQIWIQYLDRRTKEYRTRKFWYADEAKRLVDYLKKRPKEYLLVACGGFENEDEMQYTIG